MNDLFSFGTTDVSLNQMTLLVVEDDQALNHLIQKRLRRHGLMTEGVLKGADAIRRALVLAEPLLLLDYRLPDMTAREVVLELDAQQRVLPFIVMTGNGDEVIAVEMMKLGARDYLTKSDSFLDLLPTIVLQTIKRIATERRLQHAEHALRESEHRFSLLFQHTAVGIGLFTLNGQGLIANPALLRMIDYALDAFPQLNIADLFAVPDYQMLMQRIQAALSLRQRELALRRKDGTFLSTSCSLDLIDVEGNKGWLLTIEDISDHIVAQQRISHLNAVLNGIRHVNRLIVEESDRDRLIQRACESLIQTFGYHNAWIVRLDQEGLVVTYASAGFSNQYSLSMFQTSVPYCFDYALQQSSLLIMSQSPYCHDCPFSSDCIDYSRLVIQLTYNGTRYGVMSVGLSLNYVEDSEEQGLFADLARDLAFALYKIDVEAERTRVESELQTSQTLLRQALDELEQRVAERTHELQVANINLAHALRVKDEFLANMSHELRTPLNTILGRTEMFLEGFYGSMDLAQLTALRNIEESGHHLLDLINDVLDVAKIEAGHTELDIQMISVEHICESSVRLISQQALKKRLHLTRQNDPNVNLMRADGRRLKQILVNLLSNAVKFTPEGGEIGLVVEGDQEQSVVHLRVWDHGIGIAVEHMDRLFQPFTQLDSSLSRAHEGTGLGLHLVLSLAKLHGGSIRVTSELGRGSCFTVTLPWQLPVD